MNNLDKTATAYYFVIVILANCFLLLKATTDTKASVQTWIAYAKVVIALKDYSIFKISLTNNKYNQQTRILEIFTKSHVYLSWELGLRISATPVGLHFSQVILEK